jgi:hypothetical protein
MVISFLQMIEEQERCGQLIKVKLDHAAIASSKHSMSDIYFSKIFLRIVKFRNKWA